MALSVVRLIVSTDATRGNGSEDNPIRRLTRVYTLEGALVLEYDPFQQDSPMGRITEFVNARLVDPLEA